MLSTNTAVAAASIVMSALVASIFACSNVRVDVRNSSAWLQARTMELPDEFGGAIAHLDNWALTLNPATSEKQELSCAPVIPLISPPVHSKVDYSFVSIKLNGTISALGGARLNLVAEGMNDKGLTISVQFLHSAGWTNTNSSLKRDVQMPWTCFAEVILGQCSNVDEVRKMIEGPLRTLSDQFLGQFPGQHFAIDDAQGNHIVVEYIEGKPNVYDNTNVGVLTNDPQLPWHLDNLVAYAALSPNRANASDPLLVGVYKQRESMGEPEDLALGGLNTFGLPADGSSPSRFVNLFYTKAIALYNGGAPTSVKEAFDLAVGIISRVYLPRGFEAPVNVKANVGLAKTQWTVAKAVDGSGMKKFYFKTYSEPNWRLVDVSKVDFGKMQRAIDLNQWSLAKPDEIMAEDVTSLAKVE